MASQQRVTVVTDSTSYLPAGLADRLGVQVVALQVQLGGRTGAEGIDVSPADVTAALRGRVAVTTSRPSPGEFVEVYQAALSAGATSVVSLHLSAELSGTCDSARLAAAEFEDGAIRVIDSRSAAMALGFGVLAAARAAESGADPDEVERLARATLDSTRALFYVDSLEWLRRGGRIGAAAARFGTALSVKPLLHLSEGRIVPLEKVRTASKAIARLVQLAVAAAGSDRVDLAVQHLAAAERAADLTSRLRQALPELGAVYESEVGAAVGAHVGPGLLGIVIAKAAG
ncbi:MAG: DegV family protein [Actinomycetota bacterium]|nr:DegV family protein [Actinomycetota bacterium]MDQ2958544.1 DegV family protein [Actinomycetota bacterium]